MINDHNLLLLQPYPYLELEECRAVGPVEEGLAGGGVLLEGRELSFLLHAPMEDVEEEGFDASDLL